MMLLSPAAAVRERPVPMMSLSLVALAKESPAPTPWLVVHVKSASEKLASSCDSGLAGAVVECPSLWLIRTSHFWTSSATNCHCVDSALNCTGGASIR